MNFIIGIDEAGRGPFAGPVAVGVFVVSKKDVQKVLKNANDSKKLSEKKREEIYKEFEQFKKEKKCFWSVGLSSAKYIDKFGITKAVNTAMAKALKKVRDSAGINNKNSFIYLDGLLKAPLEFKQETVIKGDSLVPVIGAGSIVAKVERDRLMIKLSKKYPEYGLEKHKGYGTLDHRKTIKKYGVSDIHRKKWCAKTSNQ